MRIRTQILIASALAAALSLAPLRAEAAPQILGLMASNGLPTPMSCDGSGCTALLASFCLQEARDAPADGQVYRPGPQGGLDLILARADGTHMTIGANELVAINLYEGLSTVQVSLPFTALAARGVALGKDDTISLSVRNGTSVLPAAITGDPDPQTPEDIALATGPMRKLAAKTFDTGSGDADAAQLLGLLINALSLAEGPTPVVVQVLLDRIVAGIEPGRLSRQTVADAERIVRQCEPFPATALAQGFCIRTLQRDMLAEMNEEYWEAAGGS